MALSYLYYMTKVNIVLLNFGNININCKSCTVRCLKSIPTKKGTILAQVCNGKEKAPIRER